MIKENAVRDKSKAFALRIVKVYQYCSTEKREYVLSKQLLRSGTSIGANIREGDRAQSKAEFIAKMNIALKEADESLYWLELLHESGYLEDSVFQSMYADCDELIRLLVAIIKTPNHNSTFYVLHSTFSGGHHELHDLAC